MPFAMSYFNSLCIKLSVVFFLHISVCATSVVIRVRKKTYMWLYIFSIHSFTCLILSSHGARR